MREGLFIGFAVGFLVGGLLAALIYERLFVKRIVEAVVAAQRVANAEKIEAIISQAQFRERRRNRMFS